MRLFKVLLDATGMMDLQIEFIEEFLKMKINLDFEQVQAMNF